MMHDETPWHIREEHAVDAERLRRHARRVVDAEDRPPPTLPEVRTLADMLQVVDEPASYRINGWLPAGGRALLAAQYKAGKTTLVGNLLRSLADGEPFLGDAAVMPLAGTVAVLDTEMSPRQLRQWLRDQRITHASRILPICLRGSVSSLDLLDPDIRTKWAELLRRHGVAFLIVDCLRPILDALGLDESRECGRWLVALDALLKEAGIAECLVVHHMGHSHERSRGDSRLRDWPDVEWRLVRQDDKPHSPRFIAAFGRDVDIRESGLSYDGIARRLTLDGGTRSDHASDAALDAILAYLDECEAPPSKAAIEAAVVDDTHTRQAVREGLETGIRDGLIEQFRGGRNAKLHKRRLPA